MRDLFIVLSAMIKNKYRFSAETKKSKKVALIILIAFAYVAVTSYAVMITVFAGSIMTRLGYGVEFYVALLIMSAAFVLIFGIVHLVSTLFLSKDVGFYATLPVKPVTVFSAKLLFVYLSEAVIAIAVLLPVMLTYGIVVKAWFGFYLITVITALIVPALPLALAAIIAVPVMFIAGKLKHRDIVPLIFYCVLFVGCFVAYYYLMFKFNNGDITEDGLAAFGKGMQPVVYTFYPYLSLARAALFEDTFGIGAGASAAANVAIFAAISFALIGILIGLGRIMYGRSSMYDRSDNSKVKNAEFKSAGELKSLIKREYSMAFHTTSTAFQCFSVLLLVVVMSVMMSIMLRSTLGKVSEGQLDDRISIFMILGTICMILPSASNGAATSFSREGYGLAALKILPVDIKTILKAKIIAWSALAVPCAVISAVIANSFVFDATMFILSTFAIAGLCAAFTVFGAIWDLRAPKLKWNDPKEAIKQNTNVTIGQIILILSGLVFIITSTLFIVLGVPFDTAKSVFLSLLYVYLIIIIVIDIIICKKAEYYYSRIEL